MVGPFGQNKANAICMENTTSLDLKPICDLSKIMGNFKLW